MFKHLIIANNKAPYNNQIHQISNNNNLDRTYIGVYDLHNTFDNYISNDVHLLSEAINNFKIVNDKDYIGGNLRDNYNLGVILHGLPGTGKTQLIKTVANELNRSILIIKLSAIKTAKHFSDVISIYGREAIIVFDEFDLMLDQIAYRSI